MTRALISVSDKAGIVPFAQALVAKGIEIISTGGTKKALEDAGVPTVSVEDVTGFPEMMDGRVKTLHPLIHGGLLGRRDLPEHMSAMEKHNIIPIDFVVVNLYPFKETISKKDVTLEEAIENIDIGGPSMLRSAAKNHKYVAVICNPQRYSSVIAELRKNKGALSEDLLRDLAIEVFGRTSEYDNAIHTYLKNYFIKEKPKTGFPQNLTLNFEKIQDLRYGENPHQQAAFYREKGKTRGLINLKQLQGKELSFNNILDLNSAFELVKEFSNPAAVIVKHNNPCGVAEDKTLDRAFLAAWKCDPLSAFGGVVVVNRKLDLKAAAVISKSGFLECIIAPEIPGQVRDLFKAKLNLRLLELPDLETIAEPEFKRISGGLLLQEKDLETLDINKIKVVTKKKPTQKELEGLIFGWKVAKHVKSNAIVLTKGSKTIGIGAGQMSRVDSVMLAKKKALSSIKNTCLASDAFFPKVDAVIAAAKAGVKAIIQPGGSIADETIIKACDKYKVSMVFTGIRHFRH